MKHTMFWAFRRIRRRLPAIAFMTAAHVGQALLGVCFALGTRGVIDSAIMGDPAAFRRACLTQGIIIVCLLLCQAIYRHLHDRLMAQLDRDWKQSLLKGLLRSDYAAVTRFHSAELLNRMNNDVRTLNSGILDVLPNVTALLTRLAAALTVLIALEPWFALIICCAGVIVVVTTGLLRRNLKKLHKQVSEQEGKVSGFLQETMEKLLMVQAMDVSAEMERRADSLMDARYAIQRKRKNVSLLANTCVSLLSQGASFAALLWCAVKLLHGQLSFGSLTAVIQLVNQLQSPFMNLSAVIPQYIAMSAAAERLKELTDLEPESEPIGRSGRELYSQLTSICAEDLRFSYDRDVLMENVSLELPKGVFAVITGPSGIGKSTLLKLLLGIFHPDSGKLYLALGHARLPVDRSTRRLFAYVPQGNLLLSGTLRENLTIAKPEATEDELREALHVSAMDEFLSQLPRGLDTVLGESGAGLSEGQAQRLAIARAILGGAPILLLDECTSALDEQTEQTVLRRIRALPDRTCIAVTHRPAALELCDWQLQMQSGTLISHRRCETT